MVKVYQIYFDEESKKSLEPEYIPYYNNPTTIFFESQVMVDLIDAGKHKNCEWFGVVSHKLRKKVHGSKYWGRTIANRSRRQFTPKEFETFVRVSGADIISYTSHPPHYVFPWAEKYHPGICKATAVLCKKIKFPMWYDLKSQKVIYFNYFVARPQIYEDYVNTLLKPAIHAMKNDPEVKKLCNVNARYRFPITQAITDQTGFDYWPMYPFICERLINLYLMLKGNRLKFNQW